MHIIKLLFLSYFPKFQNIYANPFTARYNYENAKFNIFQHFSHTSIWKDLHQKYLGGLLQSCEFFRFAGYVCVNVCVCVRACVRVCVCVCARAHALVSPEN